MHYELDLCWYNGCPVESAEIRARHFSTLNQARAAARAFLADAEDHTEFKVYLVEEDSEPLFIAEIQFRPEFLIFGPGIVFVPLASFAWSEFARGINPDGTLDDVQYDTKIV